MEKSKLNPAKGVTWNLTSLYKGTADPQIEKDKKRILLDAKNLEKQYKGKLKKGNLSIQEILNVIQQYEDILNKASIYGAYASLLLSKNNHDEKVKHFHQTMIEFDNKVSDILLFVELEIQEIPKRKLEHFLKDITLTRYHQFFKRLLTFKPHILTESQESILNKTSLTGASAFVRLYDQISTKLEFPLKIDGKTNKYNYSEITNILAHHKDRDVRKKASMSITKVYKENAHIYSFILNTLLLDKRTNDDLRKYNYPQESTFLRDEIKPNIVDTMTSAIENNYKISEDYYKTKGEIQNLKLQEWDRYSTIFPNHKETFYTYAQARDIILEAFEEFSPVFYTIAKKFFDNNWIDAEISKGKQSGAFCAYTTPDKNPFILSNFTGKANDVRTLAHELGHGIHAYLSREQNLLNYWPITPLAEIASIFSENLVFKKIYNQTKDPKEKLNLLGERLQEIFATIFRQNAFHLFESDIHKQRREKGELSIEIINEQFQKRLQKMFGTSLTLSEGHKYWWISISHFYHYNFYVFSYVFGQSLSNALYSAYLNDGDSFVSNYINVLKMGSSKPLLSITKDLKVDIEDKSFWNKGLEPIRKLVNEFQELANSRS